MRLSIYHNKTLVGFLDSISGGLTFRYAPEFLAQARYPLSLSLPLQEDPFPPKPTTRFFDGLLPEEDERTRMARYLQISSTSTAGLLAALAGDCVGNLTILAPSDTLELLLARSSYQLLSAGEFQALLKNDLDLITRISSENRLSIPGAQSKIGLYCKTELSSQNPQDWYIPQGLAASTHIIKPDSRNYPLSSLNEYLCTRLAQTADIETAEVILLDEPTEHRTVLLARRFDRVRSSDGFVERLYQEDFCQALSYPSQRKYEQDGGPGFSEILDVLRSETSEPPRDSLRFAQIFLFNYLIGNCDAHAKNYSLQRTSAGRLRLAPAYDMVSTTFYQGLSRNLALGVAGTYSLDKITQEQWKQLCAATGLSWHWLQQLAITLAETMLQALDDKTMDISLTGYEQEVRALSDHLHAEIKDRLQVFTKH